MYKVAFVAGSRADYGIVRNYLSMLSRDDEIRLSLLLTGAALDAKYGNLLGTIEEDGFPVDAKIEIPMANDKICDTVQSMAVALGKFGSFFEEHKYDLLIVLGDRYEIFSAATAAAMHHIKILHLHGGELTYANYDEFIRHAITKMSWYHITSTEVYRKRVIQMGESPENVFWCGALGAENCLAIDMDNVPEMLQSLPNKKYFVVLFHPETMGDASPEQQVEELLAGIKAADLPCQYFFIGSNSDTGANKIDCAVRRFCEDYDNAEYQVNLHPDAYHFLVKNAIALVGNSSSGIIEAPSLQTMTINIGNRQEGRVRGESVKDITCHRIEIAKALKSAEKMVTLDGVYTNPYYMLDSCNLYYAVTKKLLGRKEAFNVKRFYDYL